MANLLSRVIVSPDVLYACLSHALSTEHQEIMGLLLGKYENNEAFIARSMVLNRKDKKKDRVEVSNNDLVVASTIAEDLTLTVIGWYHSHPHITVLPSHVDVKTQGQYQGLGNFLGLIFSVFDKGKMEMCCFQSRKRKSDWERVEIPVVVSNRLNSGNSLQSNKRLLESLIAMQLVLMNEDKETFENTLKINKKSYLDISRSLSVYQGGLYRLIDLQTCPLLMAMKSKISSLQYEKEKLLNQLKELSLKDKTISDMDDNIKEINDDDILHNSSSSSSNGNTSKNGYCSSINIDDNKESNLEESIKALKAFEKTMPKWDLSIRALKIAFTGMTCEIISHKPEYKMDSNTRVSECPDLKGFNKGNEYNVTVKRTDIPPISFPCISNILSPWSIVFESNETETEDESSNIMKVPLINVNFSSINGCIDFTVVISENFEYSLPGTSKINKSNELLKNNFHHVVISVKILSCSQENVNQRVCHTIIGENLNNALRLHLWPSNLTH